MRIDIASIIKQQSLSIGELVILTESDIIASSINHGSHLNDEYHFRTSDACGSGTMDLTYLYALDNSSTTNTYRNIELINS